MISVKHRAIIAVVFIWIGFVCAISFMEAWLKFRAPGVTLAIGLSVGRLVFSALNYVEWVFAIIVFVLLFGKINLFSKFNLVFFIAFLMLLLETFWALPALDARAELCIQGQLLQHSNLHFYYVAMELTKTICLAIFGIKLLNNKQII